MRHSAAASLIKKILFLLPILAVFFHDPLYASKPNQDLFFKGPSDLIFVADELNVGKKTVCELTVHYEGKFPVLALVKVYLDGTNVTSFPVEFKTGGEQKGNFSFRTERQGKHHLEFVIITPGEVQEKQFENNRVSVAFMVPGAVRTYEEAAPKPEPAIKSEPEDDLRSKEPKEESKIIPPPEPRARTQESPKKKKRPVKIERVRKPEEIKKQEAERAQLEKKLAGVKKELEHEVVIQKEKVIQKNDEEISRIEEGYPDAELNSADAVAYLEQSGAYPEDENIVPKEYETTAFSSGKPIIDVFFPDADAFKVHKSKSKNRLTLSWELFIQSSGDGEGEIQIVVADGNKQIITQHAWLRGGESLHLPMQATFDRSGPHRLTAMINTQNNFIDRNMDNNIVEQTIQIQ